MPQYKSESLLHEIENKFVLLFNYFQ